MRTIVITDPQGPTQTLTIPLSGSPLSPSRPVQSGSDSSSITSSGDSSSSVNITAPLIDSTSTTSKPSPTATPGSDLNPGPVSAQSHHTSKGAIIGGAVGGVLGLLLVALLVACLAFRFGRKRAILEGEKPKPRRPRSKFPLAIIEEIFPKERYLCILDGILPYDLSTQGEGTPLSPMDSQRPKSAFVNTLSPTTMDPTLDTISHLSPAHSSESNHTWPSDPTKYGALLSPSTATGAAGPSRQTPSRPLPSHPEPERQRKSRPRQPFSFFLPSSSRRNGNGYGPGAEEGWGYLDEPPPMYSDDRNRRS